MRITIWVELLTYGKTASGKAHTAHRYHVETYRGRNKVASRVFTTIRDMNTYLKEQTALAEQEAK